MIQHNEAEIIALTNSFLLVAKNNGRISFSPSNRPTLQKVDYSTFCEPIEEDFSDSKRRRIDD